MFLHDRNASWKDSPVCSAELVADHRRSRISRPASAVLSVAAAAPEGGLLLELARSFGLLLVRTEAPAADRILPSARCYSGGRLLELAARTAEVHDAVPSARPCHLAGVQERWEPFWFRFLASRYWSHQKRETVLRPGETLAAAPYGLPLPQGEDRLEAAHLSELLRLFAE
ncbi:MAG TPA: hypothetical protein VH107_06740 [Lacipirellulaceae bacterium]|jgi:hypothetical protein|nr:hypothetical protein [Lacipirellulaceae bacterium]